MADIVLHKGSAAGVTRVSNYFIDTFMKEANGEYVKIYLYLLRHLSDSACEMSIESMAEALDHTQLDINRALKYWQEKGIIRLEYDERAELCGICLLDEPAAVAGQSAVSEAAVAERPVAVSEPFAPVQQFITPMQQPNSNMGGSTIVKMPQNVEYSPEELAAFRQNKDIRELLFVTEQYLGRTMGPTDMNIVIYWYENLGMPADLIEHLVETCVEKGHSNIRYMNTVALDWAEQGIDSIEAARASMSSRSETSHAVMRAFGISGRILSTEELKYVKRWENDYAFSVPIIEEALNRTIINTGRPSFEYAESILKRWAEAAVKNMDDIGRLDKDHEGRKQAIQGARKQTAPVVTDRFHNFTARDYDMDELERKLLLKQN